VAKEAPERCGGAPELPCSFLAKAYDGERHGVTLGSRASKLHLAPIRRGGAVLPRCDETLMDEVRCGSPVAFGAIGGFALGSAEMVDLSQPDALRERAVYLEVVILQVDLNLNLASFHWTLCFRFRCTGGFGSLVIGGLCFCTHNISGVLSLELTTDFSPPLVRRAVGLWLLLVVSWDVTLPERF